MDQWMDNFRARDRGTEGLGAPNGCVTVGLLQSVGLGDQDQPDAPADVHASSNACEQGHTRNTTAERRLNTRPRGLCVYTSF